MRQENKENTKRTRSQEKARKSIQPSQDNMDWAGIPKWQGQDNRDKTTGTNQQEQNIRNKTAKR